MQRNRAVSRPPRVTVSGSYHRHLVQIRDDVARLDELGAEVLSPQAPRAVGSFQDFVFVASDRHRIVRLLQRRHCAAIEASDFLWLVAPDGHVGLSVAYELGWAGACGVPIFCATADVPLVAHAEIVVVPSVDVAMAFANPDQESEPVSILLEPSQGCRMGHDLLEGLEEALTRQRASVLDDPFVNESARRLKEILHRL